MNAKEVVLIMSNDEVAVVDDPEIILLLGKIVHLESGSKRNQKYGYDAPHIPYEEASYREPLL